MYWNFHKTQRNHKELESFGYELAGSGTWTGQTGRNRQELESSGYKLDGSQVGQKELRQP